MNKPLWRLYILIKENSQEGRKTTQKEICEKIEEFVYKERKGTTDKCSAIWEAINEINNSPELEKIILTKNYEYWIGSEKETEEYIANYWGSIAPSLKRYWNMIRKASKNGQYKLLTNRVEPLDETSKARAYVESFIEPEKKEITIQDINNMDLKELHDYLISIGGVAINGWDRANYICEITRVKAINKAKEINKCQ